MTASSSGYLSVPCTHCDGTGVIKGTADCGGGLPDLPCDRCCGTGKDFTPELERRKRRYHDQK